MLRILYPRLWWHRSARPQARKELGPIEGPRLRLFQFMAGLIPLSGAILMLGVGPQDRFPLSYPRLLLAVLIGLGMAGFSALLVVSNRVQPHLERPGRAESAAPMNIDGDRR